MNALLPISLQIGREEYAIDADFRNILRIFEAFGDTALTAEEQAYICLKRLYTKPIPLADTEEAIRQAYWFCDGGNIPKSRPEPVKTIDWQQDAYMLFPAVNKVLGFETRSCEFLHWWTFLGAFGEITEGLLSTVMHIRRKIGRGKRLESWEQEYLHKNKSMILLRTAEEQAEIDETEAFLRTLVG